MNQLVVAAAGSGKTTFLVKEALNNSGSRILITTYTQANEAEIRKKIIEVNGCIPKNVTVQTWFSLLLQHGVRPFQGSLFESEIKGLILVNNQSAPYVPETNISKHYFTSSSRIYSDKISKFVIQCNRTTKGAVIDRLTRIYSEIFIDELQDLAGYDLELIDLLLKTSVRLLLVCDPRQGTYSTNSSAKNKQYKKSGIVQFFEDKSDVIQIDDTSLSVNHRCITKICDLSNLLFPSLPSTTSSNSKTTGHDGVFYVLKENLDSYLAKYTPMQLRDTRKTNVNDAFEAMNFGESKGLSFERVVIYPTKPIIDWLKDNASELAETTRSKLYVALTRARQSVTFVVEKAAVFPNIDAYH